MTAIEQLEKLAGEADNGKTGCEAIQFWDTAACFAGRAEAFREAIAILRGVSAELERMAEASERRDEGGADPFCRAIWLVGYAGTGNLGAMGAAEAR